MSDNDAHRVLRKRDAAGGAHASAAWAIDKAYPPGRDAMQRLAEKRMAEKRRAAALRARKERR